MWKIILKMPSWNIDFKSLPADTKLAMTTNAEIESREYPQGHETFKPKGLWYSFAGKNNWTNWLQGWGSSEWDLNYDHVIMFETSGNILKITNEQEVREFIDEYKLEENGRSMFMDWKKVAQDYDGIEFHNQHTYRRLDYGGPTTRYSSNPSAFLYGLDIDSGCLWNTTTITNQRLYAERVNKSPKSKQRVKDAYDEEMDDWSSSDERMEEIAGTDDWKIVLRD